MAAKRKGAFPEWNGCSDCRYVPAFCGKDIRSCAGLPVASNESAPPAPLNREAPPAKR